MAAIRTAHEANCGAIAALCGQFGYSATSEQVRERLGTLAGNSECTVVVAEEAGRVVGFMQVSVHRMVESGAWAKIDGLVVDEGRRGRGIGADMVGFARGWAVEKGMGRLRVRTNEKRAREHAFYEREGFSLVKSQRVYERGV